jgi:uncharacterized C2H2 Zn-finger protein
MGWSPGGIYLGNDKAFDPDRPRVVKAKEISQYGVVSLFANCPDCGHYFGITKQGKVCMWCPRCDAWLRFVS